jgi:hypothetical protein
MFGTKGVVESQSDKDNRQRNQNLKKLRTKLQGLQSLFEWIKNGGTDIKIHSKYIGDTKDEINRLLTTAINLDPGNYSMVLIKDIWEQAIGNPILDATGTQSKLDEQLNNIAMLDYLIKQILFEIAVQTIPNTLNLWLNGLSPGRYLPFHLIVEDELPDKKDRDKMLYYLAVAPHLIKNGIVDPTHGFIYKFSPHIWHQIISSLLVLISVVISLIVIYAASVLSTYGIQEWPIGIGHKSVLLIGWIAVILGIIVHISVDSTKKREDGVSIGFSVFEIFHFVDAKCGYLILKLLFALVGLFGLVFTSGISNVTPLNAFLVGYSLDSFVDVFRSSAEQKATAQLDSLKGQLGLSKGK